ncbi:MAG: HupE/UreJ family protein [Desulfobacterales bacterium]|jgi:hypothetical protein
MSIVEFSPPNRTRSILLILMAIIMTFFFWSPVYAHKTGQSYIFLKVYDNSLTGIFDITLRDLNKAMGLIVPDDQITVANLNDRIDEIHAFYQEKVQFFEGERRLPIRFTGFDKRKLKIGQYVLLYFSIIEDASTPESIIVDYDVLFDKDPSHLGLLVIEHMWKAGIFNNESQVSLIFSPSEHRQELSFSGYSKFQGFVAVVKLGIKHIWKGIDHILFLIALIIPSVMIRPKNIWEPVTEFRSAIIYVLKIVTLFTIAHSLTLSVAALGIFELPSRLVETIIALSIAIAALDIIFPIFKRKIWWVVFIFGLFHGFGFASVLKRLGVLGEHLALSLFGFNLGVEVGLVVIICLVFPIIYLMRRYAFYPKIVMRYGAATMILVAALWFVERAFLDITFARLLKRSIRTIIS